MVTLRIIGEWRPAKYAVYLILLILSAQVGWRSADWLFSFRYYHIAPAVEMTQPVYKVGEPIFTSLTSDRYMPEGCVVTIQRYVIDAVTKAIVYSELTPGYAVNGVNHYSRMIPVQLPPGRYEYFFYAANQCGEKTYRSDMSPHAPFQVVP